MSRAAWDARDTLDRGRHVSEQVLDSATDDVHSALVPPGTLHHRVTAALANWQLDDAEELLAGVERDPSPYVAADPAAGAGEDAPVSLGKAWADTLRAELLVRRLRVAGFTLVGEPVTAEASNEPALDLHAGVEKLIDGDATDDPRAESASRAALAIARVRSAKAAFDASAVTGSPTRVNPATRSRRTSSSARRVSPQARPRDAGTSAGSPETPAAGSAAT